MMQMKGFWTVVLADVVGLGLFVWLAPLLEAQFEVEQFVNSVWIGVAFVLFVVGVNGLKKLEPSGGVWPWWLAVFFQQRTLGVLGVVFCVVLTVLIGIVVGFWRSSLNLDQTILDEWSVSLYLLLTPASWLGVAGIYVLMLVTDTVPSIVQGSARYGRTAFLGLVAINVMVMVVLVGFVPAGSSLSTFLLFIPLFLLLFLPPRLIYFSKQLNWLSLPTFAWWLVVGGWWLTVGG